MRSFTIQTKHVSRGRIAIGVAFICLAIAGRAGAGSRTGTPPGSNPGGSISVTGVTKQTGYTPQSLVPIGTFHQPPAEKSAWDKFEDEVIGAIEALDTPAAEHMTEALAVRAAMRERDMRVATRTLPKHMVVASK